MNILDLIRDLFFDYTLRTVAMGAATLGIVSGALGTFAVLRRESLLGDAISHAALPGIALAFLLTGSKAPFILIIGAALSGWLGTLLVMNITSRSRIKDDAALGIILSVFFGFGLVLLTFIQKLPTASQAGLDKYLFGQAAALLVQDVITMAALGLVTLTIMALFWKEFKLASFDPEFGATLGFPVRWLDVLLISLLVIAIVIGLQTVGVVLMSAMVVAPAAAARQWTNSLSLMVLLASLFGALAGISGSLISSAVSRMPTGPTIVLCISFIVLLSLLFAPNRGLIWNWVRHQRSRRNLRTMAVLEDMAALAGQHGDDQHGHSIAVLRAMEGYRGGIERTLTELRKQGMVRQIDDDSWVITSKGLAAVPGYESLSRTGTKMEVVG